MWTIATVLWTSLALADCPPVEVARDGATTLGVSKLSGELSIVGSDSDSVRAEGDVCKLRIRSRQGQLFVTGSTDGGAVTLTVPRALEAVTVYEHRGAVRIQGLSSRVAAVSIDGPVHSDDVPQLRTANVTGGVTVDEQVAEL